MRTRSLDAGMLSWQRSKMHTAGCRAKRPGDLRKGKGRSGVSGKTVELAIQLGDGLFEHAPMRGHRRTLEVVQRAHPGQFQLTAPQLNRCLLRGPTPPGKLLLAPGGFFLLRLDRLRLETSCHVTIVRPRAPF